MMRQSAATGNFSTAIGTAAYASGTGSFAMGNSATASGERSIAIGAADMQVIDTGNNPTTAYDSNNNTQTLGNRSVAIGSKARTSKGADDSMALGTNAAVGAEKSMAIGTGAVSNAVNSVALGTDTSIDAIKTNTIAAYTGQQNNDVKNGVVAVANSNATRRITGVAGGSNDTDAVNVSQLRAAAATNVTEVKAGNHVDSVKKTTDKNDQHTIYTVNVQDMAVKSGTAVYDAQGKGTATLTNGDGTTASVTGLKNTYTAKGALTGTTAVFTRNDGSTYDVDLSSLSNGLADKGLQFGANSGAAVTNKLGSKVTIEGAGNKADGAYSGQNIKTKVSQDKYGNTTIDVLMDKDLNVSSVTAGNSLLNTNGLTVTGGPAFTKTKVDVNNLKITNVLAGENDQDAVNMSQLKAVKNNGITNITSVLNANTSATVTYTKGDNTSGTVGTFSTTDYQLVGNPAATNGHYSVANNTVDLTVKDAISGQSKTVTIDNIASKTELDQVKTTAAAHSSVVAGDSNIVVDNSHKNAAGGTEYQVKLNDDVNVNKTVTVGTNTKTQVKIDGATGAITTGKVSINGGTTNTVTGLGNTTWDQNGIYNSGRAATEEQLQSAVNTAVQTAQGSDVHVQKGEYTADTSGKITMNLVQGDANSTTTTGATVVLKDVASKAQQDINTTNISNLTNNVNAGWNAQIDGATVNNVTPANNSMNFKTGDNIVLSNDNGAIKIATSKKLTVETIKVGDTVTINNNGIDAGGTKITNVKEGNIAAGSTDAVTGGQLYQYGYAITDIGNSLNDLDDRVNKVGAGAAALAALHPLDFDPDEKWDFAAGYGHYKGANAGSIGAFYRPNEDTMFSIGGTVGNGENMINAGVSIKFGQGNHVSTSRVAMAKEIIDLRNQVQQLRDMVNSMMVTIDPSKTKLFPDVPENHWAYEYVAKLAGNGIIEGYPDGQFKGDRTMTRYEFAAMLYRAMEKGTKIDNKLIREFKPELDRIRVDTITKHNDGTPDISRIRVISGRG